MNFNTLFEMQGMLFSLMILGAFLKKKNIITQAGKDMLSDLVIYVTLPASIIKAFMIEFDGDVLMSCLVVFIISCLIQLTAFVVNRFAYEKIEPEKRKVLQYATMCSNAGILGNPIAEGIFGPLGLLYASIYLIPQRTLMWSAGMTYFTESPDKKTLFKKVATHPCMVAVAVGFFLMLSQLQLPGFAKATIASVGNSNTAISMIWIGSILADVTWKTVVTRLTSVYCVVRLLLIPLLVFIGCVLAGVGGTARGISVVLAGMPAASVTAILAAKYGGDTVFATKCVVLSTLLSMITIPVWCLFLG